MILTSMILTGVLVKERNVLWKHEAYVSPLNVATSKVKNILLAIIR